MDYPGNLFVVSAPSGAGKSSLVKALLELDSHVQPSVSHTTRAPRGQEKHGREYFFVSEQEFDAMVAANGFVEWANVHGRRYGTSRKAIEERVALGADVVLEIDYQGALQIKQAFVNAVLIFILPPSWEELRSLHVREEDVEQAMVRLAGSAPIRLHVDLGTGTGAVVASISSCPAITRFTSTSASSRSARGSPSSRSDGGDAGMVGSLSGADMCAPRVDVGCERPAGGTPVARW